MSFPSDIEGLSKAVAGILRERRLAAGLTLTDVAQRAGLTRQMVGFVEKGTRIPSLHTFARLAVGLGVSPAALLQEAEAKAGFQNQRVIGTKDGG
ncbi:MAG: helix-turn-helix domain-containing protein [Verrucomicrobiales bacterium]